MTYLAIHGIGWSQNFSQIVSFGDSWSDAGNGNIVSGGAALPQVTAPYPYGRFTNGFTWVDYLSTSIGFGNTLPSLWGGTNFAYGGAHADDGFSQPSVFWTVPALGTQVNTYLSNYSPTGTELITIFAGGNDIASGDSDLSDEVARIGSYITQLYHAGARHFLVPTMADFSKISGYRFHSAAAAASISFNEFLDVEIANLLSTLDEITFYRPDFFSVLNDVYNDPSAYGFSPSLKDSNYSDLFQLIYLGEDPRGPITNYIWIDPIHPTNNMHMILAQAALESLDAPITPAPEPSSAILILLAGCGLCPLLHRRRNEL